MGSYDGAIIVARQVQDGKDSCGCSTGDLRGIFGKRQAGHNSIIVGLEDVLTEIHLPHPQQLVLPSRHAEARADDQTANGRIVMQLVDLLKLMGRVVDLEEKAVLAAHVHPLDLRPLLERIGVIVGVLEV
jgi:hypothetical protein